MMTLQIITHSKTITLINKQSGFTLIELLLVLAIIATIVTLTMPFASKSNEHQNLTQQALNIKAIINYAIDSAINNNLPTKIVFSPSDKSYWLEVSDETGSYHDFKPLQGYPGGLHYLGKDILSVDTEGFSQSGNELYLTFDPEKPWPQANIFIMGKNSNQIVNIHNAQVDIYEPE